jgi:hypothetical protein
LVIFVIPRVESLYGFSVFEVVFLLATPSRRGRAPADERELWIEARDCQSRDSARDHEIGERDVIEAAQKISNRVSAASCAVRIFDFTQNDRAKVEPAASAQVDLGVDAARDSSFHESEWRASEILMGRIRKIDAQLCCVENRPRRVAERVATARSILIPTRMIMIVPSPPVRRATKKNSRRGGGPPAVLV